MFKALYNNKIYRTNKGLKSLKNQLVKFLMICFSGMIISLVSTTAQAQIAINDIRVEGNQRIEATTIESYLLLRRGDIYSDAQSDASMKRLFNTGLFADVDIGHEGAVLVVVVTENPIINRIVFEGNKYKKAKKLYEEIKLRPRIVFSRSKVRSDVQRLLNLYRKGGRFAASIEPKVIELAQNRVNLVFEITEGPKSKIGRINFTGNKIFNNDDLKSVIITKEARWWRFMTSYDTYDPDRLGYDRHQLRNFYLSQGYADFRITSAVAELNSDKENFFINISLEEGEIYKFGKIKVESKIKDLPNDLLKTLVYTREGNIYNRKAMDSTVEYLTDIAGLRGYAFVNVRTMPKKNRKERTVDVTYVVNKAPRVYVDRIEIVGNTVTHDNVIRRQMRIVEGDAYNTFKMKRSKIRIKQLGFFKEVEIETIEGDRPDRMVLEVTVEEEPTGEFEFGLGFSNADRFMINLGFTQKNFMGKGQSVRAKLQWSNYSKNFNLGFTEPYFMGRNVSAGVDLYLQDVNYRFSSYKSKTIGGGFRFGFPLSEYMFAQTRYSLRKSVIDTTFRQRSPYLDNNAGTFTTSSVSAAVSYDSVDNPSHPNSGQRIVFNTEFAGIGGNVKFVRLNFNYDIYVPIYKRWILNLSLEAGHINGLGSKVKLNDRFFLGTPKLRGFEQMGVGPRELPDSLIGKDLTERYTSSLGGNSFYNATLELFVPLGSGARELGIEASAFVDVGSVWSLDEPSRASLTYINGGKSVTINSSIVANSIKPRVTAGIGFSWVSPFGPFRIDLAKAIVYDKYDRREFFQFNIGQRF
jgi:outer membrane protein insertion porin family